MCGLMGIITEKKNGFTKDDMDTMMGLLFMTQLRGMDSTGVFAATNSNDTTFYKELGTPDKLMLGPDWPAFYGDVFSDAKGMFGHCRAATKGTVNIDNAHPFEITREDKTTLTLAHNGTLSAHQSLGGMEEYDVDSHWLAAMVAEHGAEEALGRINGPIACIWHDSRDGTFNWYRNHERPLFVVETKDKKILLQSEKETLIWARHKFGLKYTDDDIKEVRAYHKYTKVLQEGDGFTVTHLVRKMGKSSYAHQPFVFNRDSHWDDVTGEWYDGSSYESRQAMALSARHRADQGRPAPGITRTEQRAALLTHKAPDLKEWPNERGLIADVKHILDGHIDHVSFENGQRISKVGYQSRTEVMNPYEAGLRVIHRLDTRTVQAKWVNGNIRNYTEKDLVIVPVDAKVISLADRHKEDPQIPLAVKLKLKPNAKVKWSTTHGKIDINHKAVCGAQVAHQFVIYENNVDGAIKLGDVVRMEVTDVIEKSLTSNLVRGYRIKSEQDMVIGVKFLDTLRNAEHIKNTGFFEGIVVRISMLSKPQATLTGNQIEVELSQVTALSNNEAVNSYAIH